ncbi:MAG: glycosyltransferase family 2 protein [Omnitrophica bacterium]|nr:glycosyltransferase family 2 protein [Candidatus Omnitrophota bacterium]
MTPALSIIIPARNAQDTIGPLLDSIYMQDFGDFEVLVVDDASCDATEETARKFDIRFFRLSEKSGPSYARNFGAKKALSEILVFFDSDVALKEGVLRKFHHWLADRTVGAVNGIYDAVPLNKGLVPLYKAVQEQVWFGEIKDERVVIFNTSVGAIRKGPFLRLGGFNTSYKGAQVEDYDFSYRFAKEASIFLDRTICVGHNFPYFNKLVTSYFTRSFLWSQLFFRKLKFDENGTTPRQGLVVMLYAFSVLSTALAFMVHCFFAVGPALFVLATILDRKFIHYAWKRAGSWFAFYTIGMNLFLSLVILFSAAAGFLRAFIKRISIAARH